MHKNFPYEARRAMAGMAAMAAMPDDPQTRSELSRIFGVDTFLEHARAAAANRPAQTSFLYLVDTHTTAGIRYIKIGKSVQPHIRLHSLQTGQGANMPPGWEGQRVRPFALRLGDLSLERAIHYDLRDYRVRRTEWFTATMAVSQYIVAQDAWNEWGGEAPCVGDFTPLPENLATVQTQYGTPALAAFNK